MAGGDKGKGHAEQTKSNTGKWKELSRLRHAILGGGRSSGTSASASASASGSASASASGSASARASGTATVRVPTGPHGMNVTSTSSGGFTRSTDESRMHDDESMDSDESIEHEHDDAMNLGPSVAYFDRSGSVVFTEEGARIICSTFQQRLDPTEGSWKSLSDVTVDFYWREFKKHATWDPRIDDSVMFRAWQSKARRRYTDWLSSIRNEKKGTEKVQPLVPQSWKEYWKSPKFLASSKQNKKNRRGGDENAPASATHTGGPLSFRETQARLARRASTSSMWDSRDDEIRRLREELDEIRASQARELLSIREEMTRLYGGVFPHGNGDGGGDGGGAGFAGAC
ncbi:unnamed protein product [Cuscuta campestris]|uniref:Uncharacterized protein n=1 Tax=Cuscuta campestris TaxID=132261 RepID=A0A484NNN4_9ASTE|nr:unnamed protein product [Cuscuta campestris]